MQFSIMDLWFATGPVGRAVVLVLLAMAMASIAVGTERLLALRRARKLSAEFLAAWRTREERPWSGSVDVALSPASDSVVAGPLDALKWSSRAASFRCETVHALRAFAPLERAR